MPTPTYNDVVNLINGNLADLSHILPAEHREVEKAILDYARSYIEESLGSIPTQLEVLADAFITIKDLADTYPTGGGFNFGGAQRVSGDAVDANFRMDFATPLIGNYFPIISIESVGSNWNKDNDVIAMYRSMTSNSINLLLREVSGNYQELKLHVTIVKY